MGFSSSTPFTQVPQLNRGEGACGTYFDESPPTIPLVSGEGYSGEMRRALSILIFFIIIALQAFSVVNVPTSLNAGLFGLFGSKTQPPPGWVLHKQTVDLDKAIDLAPADRSCGNWSWVAAVVNMAATRGAHIDQQYLVDRLYGGSICTDSAGDWETLSKQISHDYVLIDGQRFSLAARFIPGAPSQADPLIYSIRQNRPMMLLWRSRPYLLTGMTYDEYVAPTGNKMFTVTELRLFDPLAPDGKRQVIFSRDQDSPDDLNGAVELSISPK